MEPAAATPPAARPPAESDWGAFVDAYGRALLDWLRGRDLPRADMDWLVKHLLHGIGREFTPIIGEPSVRFRAWLQYATHTAWCKLMEGSTGVGHGQSGPVTALLMSMEAHDALLKAMDNECNHQRRREVLPRVQPQLEPADWEAFYAVVLENQSPAEVAAQMEGSELAVHAAVHRVNCLLQAELHRLEETC
jgi:DNA-directed RNA polymerase specialized sigma24 family protein